MAVERIMFGVGLIQIITSLCSLALCTRHYSDTKHMETTISHIAVMFAVRCLPSVSLLVCGIIGVIISCVNNATARVVHTTITAQTTIGITVNIWFFAYQSSTSPVAYDKGSATKCLIAAVFCLIACLGYLTYLSIQVCRDKSRQQESSKMTEKSPIADVERSIASSDSIASLSTLSTTMLTVPKQ